MGAVRDKNGKSNIFNDIALVRLPRPARLNAGVQMVCLPIDDREYRRALGVDNVREDIEGPRVRCNKLPLPSNCATVVGWGYTTPFSPWDYDDQATENINNFGVLSKKQQKLRVPILSASDCEGLDWRRPVESQVCAGGELGKDSCSGDSGGGLYIQNTGNGRDSNPWCLIGIVSYGSKLCGNGKPGMYTRVESFLP